LPERKQRVQALILRGEPLTIALTLLTFGFQVLLERLCEWETLIPKEISLLQISHFAMVCTSFLIKPTFCQSHSKNYNNRKESIMQVFFLYFRIFFKNI
jgi:hypothetical protein